MNSSPFQSAKRSLCHDTHDLQMALRTLRICIEGADSINDREGNS